MTGKINILQGDITKVEVDAIVNAANRALSGGGGVDGAIHRAAGPSLLKACRQLGMCETGQAKITPGFNLPASYVIHAVGPVWYGGHQDEARLLTSCYQASLKLAVENGVKRIAFPAISCGAYGYPVDEASEIAIETMKTFLEQDEVIEEILLVLYDRKTYQAYLRTFRKHTSGS